ncbi:xanthine dehydrogenase family protein molybdopterin-binding subunit [Desulfoscipio gibsoniae]|uniref:Aerobic-type carbon monoxide dehydrogenase, large subunit CoxL/CutL-like protein n=1 Tax=Desulfoscipio gibsoniae DSM 7213 TaxID=767817 RepID=R4KCK7_9FIRM|nr:xanthine dehydrogenase family protein molybdopterin-binding subunit [Desulfoscipio gibsoniae]AGL00309.1 aerobic-type carbon monoxide dehydrogenase, large subunit CoxL/CutL-like protein [Desulfoscipio gibsoniae DSM 7213]
MTDYRFIGKSTPRKDALDIVTGKTKFINDITIPDMLYGKVLRSPLPHALIKSIDTTEALSLPGVKTVLTYQNAPDWKAGFPLHARVLDKKVRYVGDAVALVAAETEDIAAEALRLIKIEYEPLPAVYDAEEALQPNAPQLYDQFPGNLLPPERRLFGPNTLQEVVIGDVEKGFAEADFIIEGTCAYENIPNPLPPEPPGVIAAWEGTDTLTVWSASQGPHMFKVTLQKRMGATNMQSIGSPVGASYGSKYMSWQYVLPAAALAKATGRPVKLCYGKTEHMAAFTVRLGSRIHGQVGMKKDGTVTALSGNWLLNTGAFSEITQGMVAVGCGEAQLMLKCPNWHLKTQVACTNRTASGQVRGFGGQELKCALVPIITMGLEKAGIDPVDFFKKNYVKPGEGYYWRDGNWWVCKGIDYTAAIEKGAETFGWKEKWKGWLKPSSVNGARRRGVGVGVHGNADVGEDISEAFVRLEPNGTATIYSGLAEHGTGQRSSICKMVAEILQLPLDRVTVTPTDSRVNPFEIGPVGSRGTYAIGSAVIAAAEDAKRQLLELMAPKFAVTLEELETEDGMVYVKGKPETRLPWIKGMGYDRTCLGRGRFEPDFTLPNFMMTFAEVEVDTETGKVDLIRVVGATDVGQIIDPPSLTNQLNGCLGSAGIDSALFEETVLDTRLGRIINPNMIDYKWRTFSELPDMEHVILETPFPSHRFQAIGIGEITPSPGPSAVLMAVSNAIGVRINDYPLTPDKVLRALGKIAAAKKEGK